MMATRPMTPQELVKQWRKEAQERETDADERDRRGDAIVGALQHCLAKTNREHADELEQALAAEAEERAELAKKAAALDWLERAAKYIHTSDSASGLGTTTFTVSKRGAISESLCSLQALAEAPEEEAETDGNV